MNIIRKIIAAVFMLVSISFAGQAQAYTILPDPMQPYDGIPVASYHDDFWSYSAKLVDALQDEGYISKSLGDFQFSTGTGGLDVLLYTGPGGVTNTGVGPGDAFNFEDPVINQGGSTTSFAGWWGQSDQDNDGTLEDVDGPVTVGQVLAYLQACNPYNTVPVFYMDLNQTGKNPSLDFVGAVYLTLTDGTIMHEWAFDNTPQSGDGTLNLNSWVTAVGEITVTGYSRTEYSVNNNLGGGKPDFIAYAPTMDLSQYDSNWLFVTEFHFKRLNNGPEEIFLAGTIGLPGTTPIPEPATMLLLGSGLIGLAGFGRRRFMKKG